MYFPSNIKINYPNLDNHCVILIRFSKVTKEINYKKIIIQQFYMNDACFVTKGL